MMRVITTLAVILVLAGLIVGLQTLYIVDVTNQVVITRFGEPVRTVLEPGLYVKSPFVEQIHRFEKRVLRADTSPEEFLTSDKKALVIDTYTRYRITDPLEFFKNLVTEEQGIIRLNQVIASEVREAIAARLQKDIITTGRVQMMDQVTRNSQDRLGDLGVEIIEVRIKRADFPPAVAESVYQRMRAERLAEANLLRAEGDREARRIRSLADVSVAQALAEAQRENRQVRGRAEAAAIETLTAALLQDPEFYTFLRSLEAYEQSLNSRDTLVLSADSDLLRFLTSHQGGTKEASAP